MQQQSSSKGVFIALGIIVIATFMLYFYFEGKPTDNDSVLDVSSSVESTAVLAKSRNVLTLLNQIRTLEIKTAIFDSSIYKNLVDYTIEIPEQPVGRFNPFASMSTPVTSPSAGARISLPLNTR